MFEQELAPMSSEEERLVAAYCAARGLEMTPGNVIAALAEIRRDARSVDTKRGLEAARARGVRLGRSRQIPEETLALIAELHAEGWGARRIANELNKRQIPTAGAIAAALTALLGQGPVEVPTKGWNPGVVQKLLPG